MKKSYYHLNFKRVQVLPYKRVMKVHIHSFYKNIKGIMKIKRNIGFLHFLQKKFPDSFKI